MYIDIEGGRRRRENVFVVDGSEDKSGGVDNRNDIDGQEGDKGKEGLRGIEGDLTSYLI